MRAASRIVDVGGREGRTEKRTSEWGQEGVRAQAVGEPGRRKSMAKALRRAGAWLQNRLGRGWGPQGLWVTVGTWSSSRWELWRMPRSGGTLAAPRGINKVQSGST